MVEPLPQPRMTDDELDRVQREFLDRNPHVVEAMKALGMSMRSYIVAMHAIHGTPAFTTGSSSSEPNVDLE